jgi:hypothetical protein
MTTTETSTVAEAGRAIAEAAAVQRAEVEAAQAKAEAAALEAERAAEEAERAAKRGVGSREISEVMRAVGAEIDGLRAAAVRAVEDAALDRPGEDPLRAWLRYQVAGSEAVGRYDAFAGHYRHLAGRDAPPGPAHRLKDPDQSHSKRDTESFLQFVTALVVDLRQRQRRDALVVASTELQGKGGDE